MVSIRGHHLVDRTTGRLLRRRRLRDFLWQIAKLLTRSVRRDALAAVTIPAMMPFESLFDGACEEFEGVEGGGVLRTDEVASSEVG